MQNRTRLIIGLLVVWNTFLTLYLIDTHSRSLETENKVRNIYNKATTISFDELTEQGSRWGFHGRDMED
ncbi:hypothetical protein ACFSKU_19825 [Pontibacter silvestris]|uniref:Uncharacterized protein n=1 Tax=Pontibacter silvestris TaxID=2305183 RepID=A0ABW4X3F2_9BACT|nr:hypothetical protein [Pontibacter silvestris]MCC9134864.1 hypothetical protein [Pontibacter silvestris]